MSTEFKETWQVFFSGLKIGAYFEDGLGTTHPIEGKVNTVKEAFATFDGITYNKGASVLKQIRTSATGSIPGLDMNYGTSPSGSSTSTGTSIRATP